MTGLAAMAAAGGALGRVLHVHGDDSAAGGATQPTARPTPPPRRLAASRVDGGAFIRNENALTGSRDWTIPDGDARPRGIEGFADRVSAEAGDVVRLFVRTTAPTFRAVAYRTGFYAGLGARRIWESGIVRAARQPEPVVQRPTRTVDCSGWSPSLAMTVDEHWPPGQYLIKLMPASGSASYVPLVIRDDQRRSDVLVISDVTTAQAYNAWGGHSLYADESGDPSRRATVVSFDRPYGNGWAQVGPILGDTFEVAMLIESLGLDVTYTTSIDQHRRPGLMGNHRVIVSGAHDEYYSLEMRNGLEAARDRGVNIVFLGANAVYRRIRFEDSRLGHARRQINYRSAAADPLNGVDPRRVTTSWRQPPAARPERSLTGTYYEGNESGLTAPMVIVDATAWMFEGTNVTQGQQWPATVREEYDRVMPGAPTPPQIQVLAHSPLVCRGRRSFSDMAYYTTPSGAGVFNAGTLQFEQRLGPLGSPQVIDAKHPDQQIRKLIANVITEFSRGPAGRTHPARPNLERLHVVR
ncbi:MAG TPA: N,N-dimethylformamidase beta subunit family domain-containing protein [Acidimicrobiales bacterium]|nr:N,N-dimethylformamidase beta subunit family domain-containing protein [Acidimicrobiales bacterium]